MRGLVPGLLVIAVILGLVVVAGLVTAAQLPEGRVIGILAVGLFLALIALVRRRGRREPAPPVLDSRRWTPGRGDLA